MKKIYLLEHLHIMDDKTEDLKTIGIYSTYEEGKEAVERLKNQPGFSNFPKIVNLDEEDYISGFYLVEYELDQDNWKEGFVTV